MLRNGKDLACETSSHQRFYKLVRVAYNGGFTMSFKTMKLADLQVVL